MAPTIRDPRLMVIAGSNAIGGMERVAVAVAAGMAARGWSARCIFSDGAERDLVPWAEGQGVAAETHNAVRAFDAPRSMRHLLDLRQLVRRWSPDVINVHYPGGHISLKDVSALRTASSARIFVNVHLPVPWHESGERKRLTTKLAAMICHATVAHSRAMAQTLLDAGVPERKIHIIHNGARPAACTPDRQRARDRFGLTHEQTTVGTLARLAPVKGIETLIDAVAALPAKPALLVAGDGPLRNELEARARAALQDRAHFVGLITGDPSDVYTASDIFVLPSQREGFPMVLLEAAMRGVAIVATDVGGVSEIIEDGRDGLVVPAGDAAAMAVAIERLLDPELRARLGSSAQRRIRDSFSESVMIDKYAALFSSSHRPPRAT